jgi:hypothetical protein
VQRVAGQLMYIDVIGRRCKLLIRKSGTRDSNPRLQPWQIGAQLKTKDNGVHILDSESMNPTQFSASGVAIILNDVEMM